MRRVGSAPRQFRPGDTMATVMVKSSTKPGSGRARAQDTDRHVGARMRERRIMLGLTQQQMAELIGVTYQQAHKYEKASTVWPPAGYTALLKVLGVEVAYFFEGLQTAGGLVPSPQRRMLLDLTRNYVDIPVRKHREAIVALARALAEVENGDDPAV